MRGGARAGASRARGARRPPEEGRRRLERIEAIFAGPPPTVGQIRRRNRPIDEVAMEPSPPGSTSGTTGSCKQPGNCAGDDGGCASLRSISIEGMVEAARLGLIAPFWSARPPASGRGSAGRGRHIELPVEESAHSHDSAAKAVELVRQGKAEALMKGSLHTDELMGAVVARETGIRTARRISHCFVMDVPGHKDR